MSQITKYRSEKPEEIEIWSTFVDCGTMLSSVVHCYGLWFIWTKQYKYTSVA